MGQVVKIIIIGNHVRYIRNDWQNNIWIGTCRTSSEHLLAPTPEDQDRRTCCKMIAVEDIIKMLSGI